MGDAPEPTPPKETSAAQTGSNVTTAIANAFLQNPTRNSPEGKTTFDPTGTYSYTDPYTGKTYNIPTFTENVSLSPGQQKTYDLNQQAEQNIAGIASNQSGFLKDYLSQPVDLSNEATESRLFELGSKRLDPRFAREEEQMRSNLISRGIREGSDAYSAAMGDFGQSRNDAYNQLLLQGRGQAVQEALTERNQPINEIIGLMSGSQVQVPGFMAQTGAIPTTDNAGIIQNYDNQKLAAWQQENAMTQSMLGGLFGLGAAGIYKSDRRAKEDIKRIGELDNGLTVYSYKYKGHDGTYIGLMADEVEGVVPEAVHTDPLTGFKMVNYELVAEAV